MHEHYDLDGNLTGTTVVTRESAWDDDSRAWALALALREDNECKRCGGDLAETLDYESWQWKPKPPLVCLRCVALAADRKAHEKNPEHVGMIHLVAKAPRPKRKPKGR